VLNVAPNINHGAAKNWMMYNFDCRTKQLDDLQVAGVGVRVRVGVGIQKIDALPLLTVATRC
jgi:hypothetical protein